jgi:hypothetical protein
MVSSLQSSLPTLALLAGEVFVVISVTGNIEADIIIGVIIDGFRLPTAAPVLQINAVHTACTSNT